MKKTFVFSSAVLISLIVLCFVSCNKPYPVDPSAETGASMTGEIHPYFASQQLSLDSVYTLTDGTKIKVTDLKFYSSNVKLDDQVLLDYPLFDFRVRGKTWFKKTGLTSVGSILTFGIGVDSASNHDDPSAFPNESWLNISNSNDMYWSWSQGFIFVKIEGKADTIVDATDNFDLSFAYHLGSDTYFNDGEQFNVNVFPSSQDAYKFQLKLDIKAFFENLNHPIDISTEYFTHSSASQAALNLKVQQNFAGAFSPL